MPDQPLTPPKRELRPGGPILANPRAPFVELGLASAFSFLRGASDPVDLVEAAYDLGYDALGIADLNSLAGIVRIHANAKRAKIRPVIGCRLELIEGCVFLAYPENRTAYGRLCTLLSQGKMQTADGEWQEKGECHLTLDMLAEHSDEVQLIALPGDDVETFARQLPRLTQKLPSLRHIAAAYLYRGDDRARIERLNKLARTNGLSILATNDVQYHKPECRPLQDIMTCIREKTTIAEAGYLLDANAERHLKSPADMQRLFAEWPHAISATREVADACDFTLDELRYEYP
ncbi:MAG: PHP domain-containing protein, partial [Pontixanthobacter sp.]